MKLPQRPRAHQIEDKSVSAFRGLMPEQWVVRGKDHDYGIDLEVEIFDADGIATGAIFLVQLKATDDIFTDEQDKTQIKVTTLNYFNELDCPVLIGRYSASQDQFLYRWAHEIELSRAAQDQKTATIKFCDNFWNDYTHDGLANTVVSIRNLKKLSETSNIPIEIEIKETVEGLSPSRLKRFVRQFVQSLSGFSYGQPENSEMGAIVIQCKLGLSSIFFSANGLLPTTTQISEVDLENILPQFAYSLAAFLQRLPLAGRATYVSKKIYEKKWCVESRQLAFQACSNLFAYPEKATELAILNQLHTELDLWNIQFLTGLLNSVGSDEVYRSYQSLIIDTISPHAPDEVIGPLYYNLGNNLRSGGQFYNAIKNYNKARKLNTSYLQKPYFVQEVAACCFLSGKRLCAAHVYERLVELDPSETNKILLGDALLFSGQFKKACEQFSQISLDNGNTTEIEANIKLLLSEWLIQFTGMDTVKRRQSEAKTIYDTFSDGDTAASQKTMKMYCKSVDPLDPFINFNYARGLAISGEYDQAVMHFLITSLTQTKDGEAWANAISCAISSKEIPTDFLISIITLAMYYAEVELIEAWDKLLEQNTAGIDFRNDFDEILEEVARVVALERKKESTVLRIL